MKKILVIEDDENIANLEKDYLELNDYNVDIYNDGAIGLEKALLGIYDLVVVDLMLPSVNGLDIVKKFREKFETPIIIVSAKVDDIDKIRGFGFGADDYLTKPFSPAELVARIKSHIMRYERLIGKKDIKNILINKALEINLDSHKVFMRGKEVLLTTKEFELLTFFAKNPNIVFTKDQLFDKIWGTDFYGDTATVAVHVQKLRKKIEKDSATPEYIETIWGTGYRFN